MYPYVSFWLMFTEKEKETIVTCDIFALAVDPPVLFRFMVSVGGGGRDTTLFSHSAVWSFDYQTMAHAVCCIIIPISYLEK